MAQGSTRASYTQAEATLIDVAEGAYDLLVNDGPSQIARLVAVAAAYNGQSNILGSLSSAGTRDDVYESLRTAFNNWRPKINTALFEAGKSAQVDTPFAARSAQWWQWLRDYLSDEGVFSGGSVDRYVTPRGWTKGSEVTTGALRLYRCNVDARGQNIETGRPQVTTFRVRGTQRAQSAVVDVLGEIAGDEPYEMLGTGANSSIRLLDAAATNYGVTEDPYLANADVTNTTTGLNWYFSGTWSLNTTAAELYLGTIRTQRRQTVQGVQASAANATVSRVCSIPELEIADQVPMIPVVAIYPDGMGTGTVTVTWGDKSQTFGSLTDTTVQLLIPDRDADLFPVNFDDAAAGRVISVQKDTAAGDLTVSGIFWIPMTFYNNAYWLAVSGTTSPVDGDDQQITDSLSEAASLNTLLARMYPTNRFAYLPSSGSNLIPNLS